MSFADNQVLFGFLKEKSSLTGLVLHKFVLNQASTRALQAYLERTRSLTRFTLCWSQLSFNDFFALAESLSTNRHLHGIDLQWNSSAEAGLSHLEHRLDEEAYREQRQSQQ